MVTVVGTSVLEVPSWLAFARTLVIRTTRVVNVPGASKGIPDQETALAVAAAAPTP
jgi:hypothetical protein